MLAHEQTSTQHFYSDSISPYSDQIFSKTLEHPFLGRDRKKISQRVGRGSRFFGCEKHFKFFSSLKIACGTLICIKNKNSLPYLPKWVGKVVFAQPSKVPKMLGHPLKGVNKDLLPWGAGRGMGEGREDCSHTTQQKKYELFLDNNLSTFNLCQTVSKALVKSIVYKPLGSPLHSRTCVCDSPRK